MVRSMKNRKAPGSRIFKASWSAIKNDVCAAVRNFFVTKKLVRKLIYTLLLPIPKKNNAFIVSDFHPISRWTVFYKIIAKLLVNRLQNVLDKCIMGIQSAFIPRYQISDNIILSHECVKKLICSKKNSKLLRCS